MIAENFNEIFEKITTRAKPSEGDYYGEDGFLYCGKCHTKKETVITVPNFVHPEMPGKKKLVPVMCKCREEEVERRRKEEEYQEQMAEIDRIKKSSLIESKFRDASFKSFQRNQDNEKIFRIASRYVENFEKMQEENQGILFYGDVGTGKSFTAAVIANELLVRKKTVIMTSFVNILQEIKDLDADEEGYMSRLNSASLLIIDDLGAERNTDFALEKVYSVIDSRYRVKKPLILTTNLNLRDMQQTDDMRYKRIYDRIFEMCYPVRVTGKSWRQQEAGRRFDRMKELMEG